MNQDQETARPFLPPLGGWRSLALGGLALAVMCYGSAHAIDWQLTHTATTRVNVTDNIGLDPDSSKEAAIVPSASYSVSGTGQGGRVLFATDSSVTVRANTNSGRGRVSQAIRSLGRVELWRDRLFLDGTFSSTRQFTGVGSASSANPDTDRNRQNSVTTLSISPVYQHHFGSFADLQASYRHTEIFATGRTDDARADAAQLTVEAGRRFTFIKPSVTAAWFRYDERPSRAGNSDDDLEQASIQVANTIQMSRRYAILTTLGYDEVDAPSSTRDLSGFFWSVGLAGTPGPRLQFSFQVGQRYDTFGVVGSASYQLTDKLALRLTASQDVSTGLQRAGTQIQQLSVSSQQGVLTNNNGLPAGFLRSDLSDGVSINQELGFGLVGDYGRNTVSVGGTLERREFNRGTQNLRNIRASVTRELGRRTNATIAGFYRYVDDVIGADTHAFGSSASLSYQLGQRVSVFATVSRTDRISEDRRDEFAENAVTVGGRLTF